MDIYKNYSQITVIREPEEAATAKYHHKMAILF